MADVYLIGECLQVGRRLQLIFIICQLQPKLELIVNGGLTPFLAGQLGNLLLTLTCSQMHPVPWDLLIGKASGFLVNGVLINNRSRF